MPKDTDRQSAGGSPAEHCVPSDDRAPRQDEALSVERHRKADGRLLILYRWVGKDG
ncbi:MAG TPA: hypothetical protein VG147_13815 [Solirubrobacteraceae bacterium]|jgi:hypothetical protein|nr:hypothetical protein [Solirubrobacteraceae bacterium]